jgi:hypothetical protein
MQDQGYIVLYNPISNEGHLDSWHILFAHLLLRAGWGVIMLTTAPQQLKPKCTQRGLFAYNRFVLFAAKSSDQGFRSKLRNLAKRIGVYLDTNSFCGSKMRRFASKLSSLAVNLRRVRKALPSNTWVTHLDPLSFQTHTNLGLDAIPGQVQAVFNMYVDAYPLEPSAWKEFSLPRGIPWMGLCITPQGDASEPYYRDPSYKGTCFLDEAVCQHYRDTIANMHFAYLPDVTETALPEVTSPLAQEVLRRAGGRAIVFMGGSIGKQKNFARWCALIQQADPREWFFLQVGRLNKNNLGPDDELALVNLQADMPENLFVHADFIADERYFNELIALSDIVFAVYRDFKRSSNMLSKAAEFEKPIIVSDDCLMGERVRRYGIGQVVQQDDVVEMYKALQRCRHLPPKKTDYAAFRTDFSEDAMQRSLTQFMRACLAEKAVVE